MTRWIRRWRGGRGRQMPVDGRQSDVSQDSGRLSNLDVGQEAEVFGVDAGRKARCRLASLGLIPGSKLRVVANCRYGPMLLSLGETRLMVERGVATKVLIKQ